MDHPSLLAGMPSDSELGPVRRSERRAEKLNPKLPTKRTHVPAKRYQLGYDLGTDGRFAKAPRKHRRVIKKTVCTKAIATPPSSDPEEDNTDETDVAPPLPPEPEQVAPVYTRPLPTGRAVKWTAEEDAKLYDVMRSVLGIDRNGYIEPCRIKAGGWRAVAKAMGFDDLDRAARRCHRRWFFTSPYTKSLADKIRTRHNIMAQQRKHSPWRRRPVSDRNLPPLEDDNGSDELDNLLGDEDYGDIFGDLGDGPLEGVPLTDFVDSCFDNSSDAEAEDAHMPVLTTDETLPAECDDDIMPKISFKTRLKRPNRVANPIFSFIFSSTNLGRTYNKFGCTTQFGTAWEKSETMPQVFGRRLKKTRAFPAPAQSPSPPDDVPVPVLAMPIAATVAPPLIQETLDSYLRICKGLASVDPKAWVATGAPSARFLMKEFEDCAARVVEAAKAMDVSPPPPLASA